MLQPARIVENNRIKITAVRLCIANSLHKKTGKFEAASATRIFVREFSRMSFYPNAISQRIHEAEHSGAIAVADARATCATPVCGCALSFEFKIDRAKGKISAAGFLTNGCGFMISCAEVLTEEITGRLLADLHGLADEALKGMIEDLLGIFPASREHCLRLSLETLHQLFQNFRDAQIENWQGEEALICTCFGVSEKTIEKLLCDEKIESVKDITRKCNAGGGCGSCQPLIQDMIDTQEREFRSS
jgi:NifU-like protein